MLKMVRFYQGTKGFTPRVGDDNVYVEIQNERLLCDVITPFLVFVLVIRLERECGW